VSLADEMECGSGRHGEKVLIVYACRRLVFPAPITAQPTRAFLRPFQGIAVGVEKKCYTNPWT
jgi:hypothetical protein